MDEPNEIKIAPSTLTQEERQTPEELARQEKIANDPYGKFLSQHGFQGTPKVSYALEVAMGTEGSIDVPTGSMGSHIQTFETYQDMQEFVRTHPDALPKNDVMEKAGVLPYRVNYDQSVYDWSSGLSPEEQEKLETDFDGMQPFMSRNNFIEDTSGSVEEIVGERGNMGYTGSKTESQDVRPEEEKSDGKVFADRSMERRNTQKDRENLGFRTQQEFNDGLKRYRTTVAGLEQRLSAERPPLGYAEALGTLLEATQRGHANEIDHLSSLLAGASNERRTPADIDRLLSFARSELQKSPMEKLGEKIKEITPQPTLYSSEAEEMRNLQEQKSAMSGELRTRQLEETIRALEEEQVTLLKEGAPYGKNGKSFFETFANHKAMAEKFISGVEAVGDTLGGFIPLVGEKTSPSSSLHSRSVKTEMKKNEQASPRESISKWRNETLATIDELVTNLPQGVDPRVMEQFEKYASVMSDYDYTTFTRNIESLKDGYRSSGDRKTLDQGLIDLFRDPLTGSEKK